MNLNDFDTKCHQLRINYEIVNGIVEKASKKKYIDKVKYTRNIPNIKKDLLIN